MKIVYTPSICGDIFQECLCIQHNVWLVNAVAFASRWHVFLQGTGTALTYIFLLFIGLAKIMTPCASAALAASPARLHNTVVVATKLSWPERQLHLQAC